MGVNFYLAKRCRGKLIGPWNWPGKDWNGMGYGHFLLTRARIASFFNPRFGLVYEHAGPCETSLSPEDKDMLYHVDRHLPPAVCDFICEPDTDGRFSRKRCAALLAELEGIDTSAPVAPCTIEITETWRPPPNTKTEDNAWMNHEDWIRSAEYVLGGIREAARRGCAFEWS